jgi:hypothetical protein
VDGRVLHVDVKLGSGNILLQLFVFPSLYDVHVLMYTL